MELCEETRCGLNVHFGVDDAAQVARACVSQHSLLFSSSGCDVKHRVDGSDTIVVGHESIANHGSVIVASRQYSAE